MAGGSVARRGIKGRSVEQACPRTCFIEGRSYRVGDLELLALADVIGLGDGALQPRQGPVVERLQPSEKSSAGAHVHNPCQPFHAAPPGIVVDGWK